MIYFKKYLFRLRCFWWRITGKRNPKAIQLVRYMSRVYGKDKPNE